MKCCEYEQDDNYVSIRPITKCKEPVVVTLRIDKCNYPVCKKHLIWYDKEGQLVNLSKEQKKELSVFLS